jgi:DNA-binding beta-propeller fold protein YncE
MNQKIALTSILIVMLIVALVVVSLRLVYFDGISTTISNSTSVTTRTGFNVTLDDSMPLPNVADRFDHMSFDQQRQHVFIAARGNNSVYVADLITEGVDHVIRGLDEPQGVYYDSQYDRLYVSNGGDGTVDVFNGGNYSLITTLGFSNATGDADNIRYDWSTGLLYVGYGDENQSGLGIINTSSDAVVGFIPLNGHPESFQIEQNGTRIFVNVPTANSIEVVDKVNKTLLATWPLSNATENFPMALDEKDHRLFVGFWSPSVLIVYDTNNGKIISTLNTPQDADDLYYDPFSQFIFASCGSGSLFVIKQQNADSYQSFITLPTGPLGRTSLFFPEGEKLYVAVPQHGVFSAVLLTFSIRQNG